MKNLHKLFFLAAILMMSCEGPIGPEGPEGPAGPTGATGATGSTGSTGSDGSDGADGSNGADGNANVQTFIFTNPIWGSTTWGANAMSLNVQAITQTVFDNDLIQGYIYVGGSWYSADAHYYDGYFRSYIPDGLGEYVIKAYNNDDTTDTTLPTVNKVKVIIITSTSTSTNSGNGRTASPQAMILKELADEGVDINDYYAVRAYYNLND